MLTPILLLCTVGLLDRPNAAPEDLYGGADLVVLAEVAGAYSDAAPDRWATRHVAELRVIETSKGDRPPATRLLYARCTSYRPTGEPGWNGMSPPPVGAKVRVYLASAEDGGWDVVEPNGFADPAAPLGGPADGDQEASYPRAGISVVNKGLSLFETRLAEDRSEFLTQTRTVDGQWGIVFAIHAAVVAQDRGFDWFTTGTDSDEMEIQFFREKPPGAEGHRMPDGRPLFDAKLMAALKRW